MASSITSTPSITSASASPDALLEYHLAFHDHVPNEPATDVLELRHPVAEAIVADDPRTELASEREDEIIGVRAGRRLLQLAVVHQLLVRLGIVDLMTQGGIDDEHGLETFLGQLVAHENDVLQARRAALGGVGDVGAIHDRDA